LERNGIITNYEVGLRYTKLIGFSNRDRLLVAANEKLRMLYAVFSYAVFTLANNPNPIKKGCKDILYWRYFHGKDLS
jgi:hypothetical protein